MQKAARMGRFFCGLYSRVTSAFDTKRRSVLFQVLSKTCWSTQIFVPIGTASLFSSAPSNNGTNKRLPPAISIPRMIVVVEVPLGNSSKTLSPILSVQSPSKGMPGITTKPRPLISKWSSTIERSLSIDDHLHRQSGAAGLHRRYRCSINDRRQITHQVSRAHG